jgi:uncharacterized protein (DUF58 family)
MAGWIRRAYTSAGLTQIPTGPYLRDIQSRYGGTVMLMIDVSGSMDGRPILEAARGAKQFVEEAVEANYHVGLMLWNTEVVSVSVPERDGAGATRILAGLHSARGGNYLILPLNHCHEILDGFTGDRVVALFGDGDLTPKGEVLVKVAKMKSENIRFVTRGLGSMAAREFGEISDDEPETAAVEGVQDIAEKIAGMSSSLKTGAGPARG